MGPSGSGKTTLLNSLANHVPAKSGMKLTGKVAVRGCTCLFVLLVGGMQLLLQAEEVLRQLLQQLACEYVATKAGSVDAVVPCSAVTMVRCVVCCDTVCTTCCRSAGC